MTSSSPPSTPPTLFATMKYPDLTRSTSLTGTSTPNGGRYGSFDDPSSSSFESHQKELEARLRGTLESDEQGKAGRKKKSGKGDKDKGKRRMWERSSERVLWSTSSIGRTSTLRSVSSLAHNEDVFDSDADLSTDEEDLESFKGGATSGDELLGGSLRKQSSRRLRRTLSGVGGDGEEGEEKQWGVVKMEMMARSWGKRGLITVYAGVYLISILTSLEGNTTPTIEPYFLSLLDAHSMLGAVAIVTNIAFAVGKPPMAKILDVFGRLEGLILSTALYSLGYLLTASSTSSQMWLLSRALAALGGQGVQLSQQLLVADTTTLTNRGLITSTISLPWLITTWLGPPLGSWFQQKGERGYRTAYGLFGVLLPVMSSVLIINLGWQWRKAKKRIIRHHASLVHSHSQSESHPHSHEQWRNSINDQEERDYEILKSAKGINSWASLMKRTWKDLDMVGLAALTIGCGLVLLPLTLAAKRPESWADLEIWLLFSGGIISLAFFGWYEFQISPVPLLPPRLLRNKTIVCGSLLGLFHFCSQFCYESFFTSFLQVARGYSPRDASYIAQSYIFAASIAAIVAGFGAKYTQRYKWIGIAGVVIHAIGTWLMMRMRNLDSSTAELVLSQVIGGVGGGFTTIAAQIGCQSVVGHQDVGIATAIFLTITQIGGAIGGSIAGAVWSTLLPSQLLHYLSPEDHHLIPEIMASLSYTLSFEQGTPVRLAIEKSYVGVQRNLNILAISMLIPAFICAALMRNTHLEKEDQGQGEGVVVLGRASFVATNDDSGNSETSSLLANAD